MSERIEYKKTIVFDSAESRMLYDAITAFESRNKGITQSAFVNDFIKSAFLPDYPIAKGFCERLYLIDHTGESVFDILSDLFLFLAEKTNIERFTTNRSLVYILYENLKEDIKLEVKQDYLDEFKIYVEMLEGIETGPNDGQITLLHFFTLLDLSPDMFNPKLFLHKVCDKWEELCCDSLCYVSLSYLCKMLPKAGANTDALRISLISLIKEMSKKRWSLGESVEKSL